MIAQGAAAVSSQETAPGFFLLAWGLVASVVGLGLVTNFRGFAHNFARNADVSSALFRRLPSRIRIRERPDEPTLRLKRVRLIGIPFAVLGPIVTIVGLVQIVHGHISVPRGPALPLPFALAFIAFAVVVIGQYWRDGGLYRVAALQGGWRRVAAVLASGGAVSFGVFSAVGETTLGIAGWLIGGLATAPLLIGRKAASPGTHDTARSSQPGEDDEGRLRLGGGPRCGTSGR
jgi:hypothetical protein